MKYQKKGREMIVQTVEYKRYCKTTESDINKTKYLNIILSYIRKKQNEGEKSIKFNYRKKIQSRD